MRLDHKKHLHLILDYIRRQGPKANSAAIYTQRLSKQSSG
jgi:hypothetical protein